MELVSEGDRQGSRNLISQVSDAMRAYLEELNSLGDQVWQGQVNQAKGGWGWGWGTVTLQAEKRCARPRA